MNFDESLAKHIQHIRTYYENIIGGLPCYVYWKDKDFVYLGCNDLTAQLLHLPTRHAIVGKTDYDFGWEEDVVDSYRTIDMEIVHKGEAILNIEETVIIDEKLIYLLVNKEPLFNEHNEIIGILGISIDITDRKRMENDLLQAKIAAEAASLAKTEFIANMGHDIRTPLTGIIGLSQHLEEEIQTLEGKEWAKQVHESGKQLLGLLNGVLDLITADIASEDNVRQAPFNIRQLMHDVLELERPAVTAHQLLIESHIDEKIPPILVGDEMKLHRILLNLAGNAIKFTKEGHIELNARLLSQSHDEAKIEFAVKDTGIGIPDNLQQRVFDQFFKISPSYKGLYVGNGIGLHIVQKYVALLGGEIKLASQVSVGTTFSFVLSLKVGNQLTELTSALSNERAGFNRTINESTPLIETKSIRVLLVEDNIPSLSVINIMMKKLTPNVSTAVNAELAFELMKSHLFDLVITDIGLPGHSGDELSTMIRALEKDEQRVPAVIVGLTGHAMYDIQKRCLDAGMNYIYSKPIAFESLKKLTQSLVIHQEKSTITHQPASSGALGEDLPYSENELFELDQYPILDMQLALKNLGSETIAHDIFNSLITEGISDDLAVIQQAHDRGDWKTVEKLAHKMKGGACYGTVRLYYALLYMERYLKASHMRCVEALYSQMLNVIEETMTFLKAFLIEKM
jgi:two-component system aerobic respiration control sensor histidine kinase ArcB